MNMLETKMQTIIEEAGVDLIIPNVPEPRIPITVWVSRKDKDRYDLIQYKTRKSFSKVLRTVIIKAIESYDEKLNSNA
jgi:hypothetical protein